MNHIPVTFHHLSYDTLAQLKPQTALWWMRRVALYRDTPVATHGTDWRKVRECDLLGFVDITTDHRGTQLVAARRTIDPERAKYQHRFCREPMWRTLPITEPRPAIPNSTRTAVMARDGHRCVVCGAPDQLTLDHIQPYSQGGPDTLNNLRTLCKTCNSRRGAARISDEELVARSL